MRGISKSFGGVRALKDVDLTVEYGEIHALVGENGAGKSTILKILRGVLAPGAGTIEISGEALAEISAEAARRAGIAMIFQEMSLIPTLTVAQNIFLNHELRDSLGLIDEVAAAREAKRLFELLGVEVDPAALAGDLGAGQRQLTEIVKAISQHARILILDEPTSALTGSEVERLFALLARLRSEGLAIIYVSHRMDEIMRIADRATILRDGNRVITAPLSELTLDVMVAHIVGRQVSNLADLRGAEIKPGEPLLTLERVSGRHKPRDVSFTLHRGEVLGIAGLLGSGRSSLARLLCGIDPIASGEMRIAGRAVRFSSASEAIAHGIALVPEDRNRQGLIAEHDVAENIALPMLDRLSRWRWLPPRRAVELAEDQIARLGIKARSPEDSVRSLSGGNQQKVVLAKWLATDPAVLVLDEPTAGIDIGSKSEIISLVRRLAREGKGIVLISSELSELLAASDRILVMAEGRIVREIGRSALDPAEGTRGAVPVGAAEHRLQLLLQEARRHV